MSLYKILNDVHKKLIIQLGESMYNHLNIHKYSDEEVLDLFSKDVNIQDKLNQQFNLGKLSSKSEIDHYKNLYESSLKQSSELKSNFDCFYEKKFKELESQLIEKTKIIETLVTSNQTQYERGLERGNEFNLYLLDEQKKQLQDKNELIDVYRPQTFENTKEKGDVVENMISDDFVRKIDRMAYVTDTSDVKGSGDRIVVFPDYKMMIECKHKTSIKKSDIEQFCDHYNTDFLTNLYDVALFISYSCEYVLGKGSFNIEQRDDKIIGYLGLQPDISQNQKSLIMSYFLSMIHDIRKTNFQSNNKQKNIHDCLYKSILEIYNDILHIEKYEIPLMDSIQTKYTSKKHTLQDYIIQFEYYNIPIPLEIQSINGTEEIFIDKLIQKINKPDYIIPKQNWKKILTEEYNLDVFYQKFLNKKGITRDKIVERYNDINKKNKIID